MQQITKTVLTRIMWMARGTATAMGLAVMLALTVGLASTALAAAPGDPFKLGQLNDALSEGTGLTSSRSGPTLDLSNTNDGSITERAIAPALGLAVQPGQPPLTINPGAGKATNLDSDKLDGKDSTAFANGTGGKANDADKLDGVDSTGFLRTTGKAADADKLDNKDSTQFANGTGGKANDADKLDGVDSSGFFSGKSYLSEDEGVIPSPDSGGGFGNRFAKCDPGDRVLSGGHSGLDFEDVLRTSKPSKPGSSSVDGWFVEYYQDAESDDAISAYVLCADLGTPHQDN